MKKILIIEDDEFIRNLMYRFLSDEGFTLQTARNGKEGFEYLRKDLPDLVFCDIEMPVMDGFGVLQGLRSDPIMTTIPFIFLTAKAEREDMRRGMEGGADDYITKPFSKEDLLNAIKAQDAKQSAIQKQVQKKIDDLRKNLAISLPHELRTPLSGIIGASSIIMDDCKKLDCDEINDLAEIIMLSSERLQRLIQNYLLYAELEIALTNPEIGASVKKNRLRLGKRYPYSNTRQIIEKAAQEEARRAGRTPDLAMAIIDGDVATADDDLKLIVEELVMNAFKFSRPGMTVTVKGMLCEKSYALSVSNGGRGMTAAQIANLGAFTQFERNLYEQQGLGLGLALVKKLSDLYNGTFNVESIPNITTMIKLVLPENSGEDARPEEP
jgi:CheY-like chemotaxis protein